MSHLDSFMPRVVAYSPPLVIPVLRPMHLAARRQIDCRVKT
ncbi:MAG: hypothetical protein ACJASV_000213 [Pseudorhodobacter sp.]|jgi:hypothetical protein